jgi:hypothetical protein
VFLIPLASSTREALAFVAFGVVVLLVGSVLILAHVTQVNPALTRVPLPGAKGWAQEEFSLPVEHALGIRMSVNALAEVTGTTTRLRGTVATGSVGSFLGLTPRAAQHYLCVVADRHDGVERFLVSAKPRLLVLGSRLGPSERYVSALALDIRDRIARRLADDAMPRFPTGT